MVFDISGLSGVISGVSQATLWIMRFVIFGFLAYFIWWVMQHKFTALVFTFDPDTKHITAMNKHKVRKNKKKGRLTFLRHKGWCTLPEPKYWKSFGKSELIFLMHDGRKVYAPMNMEATQMELHKAISITAEDYYTYDELVSMAEETKNRYGRQSLFQQYGWVGLWMFTIVATIFMFMMMAESFTPQAAGSSAQQGTQTVSAFLPLLFKRGENGL